MLDDVAHLAQRLRIHTILRPQLLRRCHVAAGQDAEQPPRDMAAIAVCSKLI